MTVVRGVIEAGRFSGLVAALKTQAHLRGVQCQLDIDRGWLVDTIRYTLTGKQDAVSKLLSDIGQAIYRHNAEVDRGSL